MAEAMKNYFAPMAWVGGAWAKDVLLGIADDGSWASIEANCRLEQRRDATRLSGPVIAGMVNAHSHAFQRAIAGMTERSSGPDNFWSWRDRMYSAALRITPEQLGAIAAQLYAELLQAGYTQVCEFHYLHNDLHGKPYANPLEMSCALVRAAQRVGIGITLLPTLYMRSGFAAKGLREDQRRFDSAPAAIFKLCDGIEQQFGGATVNVGMALHSLRAVGSAALHEATAYANARHMPIHIHVAEQTSEVADCLASTGRRPVEWLLDNAGLHSKWNLVHATHTTPAELQGIQASGAAVVLCPTTEANLGDGVFDLPHFSLLQGNWSIGSDSHVTRSWQEELRLLEYSQRLVLQQRNVMAGAASNALGQTSTAATLFDAALKGGSCACGLSLGGLAIGQRADFSVIDMTSAALLGVPASHLLDAFVFSSPDARLCDVFVAGQQVIQKGQAHHPQALADDYSSAVRQILV
jgi:formimidoylglutamate deiminase